jgi:2-polyprenyl-3-methyl-5-hydroxy-6-metoxy-1,4-benzoquinol methylase
MRYINFKINHRYDLVIFTEVLEHLLQDDEIIMMNVKKLVRPGGLLLISVPNALTFSNRVKVITGKNIYWSVDGS